MILNNAAFHLGTEKNLPPPSAEGRMRAALEAIVAEDWRWAQGDGHPFKKYGSSGEIARAALASEPTEVDMAAFGASDAACYLYPNKGDELLRAAFIAGAAHAVRPSHPDPELEGAVEKMTRWIEDEEFVPPYGAIAIRTILKALKAQA
jgi:hypothetical protein